jgi:hypothetical protein
VTAFHAASTYRSWRAKIGNGAYDEPRLGLLRQLPSELDVLRDAERSVDLDPEIANGALGEGTTSS